MNYIMDPDPGGEKTWDADLTTGPGYSTFCPLGRGFSHRGHGVPGSGEFFIRVVRDDKSMFLNPLAVVYRNLQTHQAHGNLS
jgi:hypothetical protein